MQPKKVESGKNIHIKKTVKVDVNKKPGTAQKGGRVEGKSELGAKINKKLESLNIKTGKNVEPRQNNIVQKNNNAKDK